MTHIMDREAYMLSIGYDEEGHPVSITKRFDQGQWWLTKAGDWVRIDLMSAGHRYNTAAMLMRAAAFHAFRYALAFRWEVTMHDGGEMAHDSLERLAEDLWATAMTDPRGWLASTALYRTLTLGLAVQGDGTQSHQATGTDPVTGEAITR